MKRLFYNNITKAFLLLTINFFSCSEFLEIDDPSTQVNSNSIFEDDAAAFSAITGIYSEMMSSSGFASGGLSSVTLLAGRSGDDFKSYSKNATAEFSTNEITENNSFLNNSLWKEVYRYVYNVNAIIEGLNRSSGITVPLKKQLQGEAKFLRAFCYFYLVNFFNEVPLITSTDYRTNSVASRVEASEVYKLIITDLIEAKTLLADDYSFSAEEKARPNKWAAVALLSRVYLYTQSWVEAEMESSLLIDNNSFALENDLNAVFLKNSNEAIWQLIPHKGTTNTKEGAIFILTSVPNEVSLTDNLVESFEAEDLRKAKWIGTATIAGTLFNYAYKYKVKSGAELQEYSMVFRLAEQYLIRAEAKANQGKLMDALIDLDTIRQRAGVSKYQETDPAISKENLLLAIEKERRLELFAEWGHRWLDLKRTDRADEVLSSKIGSSWQSTDILYPIPFTEIQNNTNLLPQNPGY